jgi:acetyl-CoA acetyltransferase
MRRFGILLLASAFTGVTVGSAASLALGTEGLGAARVSVPRCTSAGVAVVPNLSGPNVVSVTVGSLPAACGGATLQVAVNNGAASSSGSGTVPAGGGSVTVALAAAVAAVASEQIDIVLVGP